MPGWLLTFHLRLHEFFTPVSKDFLSFQTISFHFIKWILLKHQLLQHPNRRLVWNAVCITTAFFGCCCPFCALETKSRLIVVFHPILCNAIHIFFYLISPQEPKIKFDACNQTGPYTRMSCPNEQWTVHATDVTSRIFILQIFFWHLLRSEAENKNIILTFFWTMMKLQECHCFFIRFTWSPSGKLHGVQRRPFYPFEISPNGSGESLWHFTKLQLS
jgi:hypothetical protein